MTLSQMKKELHDRLWQAYQHWLALKENGASKRALKLQGLRDHDDLFHATRALIFTGNTRLTYERELKRFLDYCSRVRGRIDNRQIDHRDFKSYMEHQIARGLAANELHKIRSAIAKFGALYGKTNSFHSLSKKFGKRIRLLVDQGHLPPPHRPRVTPKVRDAVIDLLQARDLEAERKSGVPRAYHLALRLQKEASLRSIEATSRFTPGSLLRLDGDPGIISVLGKGGRVRELPISRDLYLRLEAYFTRSNSTHLAPLRSYQEALRRATLAVGGRSTGSHAHRRTSAVENKNRQYGRYVRAGVTPKQARHESRQDTIENLGHSRSRRDLAKAYLS